MEHHAQNLALGFSTKHFLHLGQFSLGLIGGSLWVLIASVLVGFVAALWTYQRTIPPTTRAKKNILIALRSFGIAFLLFALFQPIASLTHSTELVPSVALVLDNSQSMQLPQTGVQTEANSGAERRRDAMLKSIRSAIPSNVLSDKN